MTHEQQKMGFRIKSILCRFGFHRHMHLSPLDQLIGTLKYPIVNWEKVTWCRRCKDIRLNQSEEDKDFARGMILERMIEEREADGRSS